MSGPGVLDDKFFKGVEHFNKQEFFDAHEVWEELWKNAKGESRHFLQGLIQIATALHHFRKGNLKGARILIESGTKLLSSYGEKFRGMDLSELLIATEDFFGDILKARKEDLPGRYDQAAPKFNVKWNEQKVPRIKLESV